MKLNPKFIQFNCVEENEIDLRQAEAVIRHKPDIIIFEMPQGENGPSLIFNRYSCSNKPIKEVDKIIKNLKISAKKYPYAASDIVVWKNVKKLWKEGINTQVYNVDSPARARKEFFHLFKPYPACRKDWLFGVYLYVREYYMTKNIQTILDNYSYKKNPTVLIFLESIHWNHVKFLLIKPSKEKIWAYYFGKFINLKPKIDIEDQIKSRSKILYYYWKKIQDFY